MRSGRLVNTWNECQCACCHHAPDLPDEVFVGPVLEQVRHGVDENALRLFPVKRRSERGLVNVHAPGPDMALAGLARGAGVFRHAHRLQARRHAHGVAIGAAGREHLAAGDRIPRRLGPFDVGCGHCAMPLRPRRPASSQALSPWARDWRKRSIRRYMVWSLLLVRRTQLFITIGKIRRSRFEIKFELHGSASLSCCVVPHKRSPSCSLR